MKKMKMLTAFSQPKGFLVAKKHSGAVVVHCRADFSPAIHGSPEGGLAPAYCGSYPKAIMLRQRPGAPVYGNTPCVVALHNSTEKYE